MPANPIQQLHKYFRKKKELKFFKRSSNKEIFTQIYEKNKWGDDETRSGKGSNLDRTEQLRQKLPGVLAQLNVRTLLDIPCGDYYWMKQIDLAVDLYIGADIVASLVQENSLHYGNQHRQFRQLDLLHDKLPQADAILCRECLGHLSFEDIILAISNIKASSAVFLLTTHFSELRRNSDIVTGKHLPLNLQLPPFGWPAPLLEIAENNAGPRRGNKCLSLWRISDLP